MSIDSNNERFAVVQRLGGAVEAELQISPERFRMLTGIDRPDLSISGTSSGRCSTVCACKTGALTFWC